MTSKQSRKWGYLFFFLAACILIEVIGGSFTASSVSTWYSALKKASWTPPSWVFGPVWTLLYIMIAIAGWLIYLKPSSETRKNALILYFVQLGLNFLWSYLFFYLKSPPLGFLDILLLLIVTGRSIFVFWRISHAAAFLFVPYLLWTLYAATLNAAICFLNRS